MASNGIRGAARLVIAASALLYLGVLNGCASGTMGRLGDAALPKDLPKDLQQKFEIKEVMPAPTPTSGAQLLPAAQKLPERKKKALLKKAVQQKKIRGKNGFQWISRRPAVDPIWLGEKQSFEITYFGMAAGELDLTVLPYKMINDRKVYDIRGEARSSKVFGLFYKVDDSIETFLDYDGLFSHRFHLVLNETKQTRDALELYDSEKKQTYYWNRWHHRDKGYIETKNFYDMAPFAQDSVSALYYVRTLPLKTGDVYTFPVVSEGKTWEAVVYVLRREKIQTALGTKDAIVIKPETKYQGILQKKGDSYIWFSDDDRRIVLRVEGKVRIGTIVANITHFDPGVPPAAQ